MGISNPEIQKKVTEMGTRDRKARLAVLEKAHAPTAGLSYMQAQITNSKTSMSAIACLHQPSRLTLEFSVARMHNSSVQIKGTLLFLYDNRDAFSLTKVISRAFLN